MRTTRELMFSVAVALIFAYGHADVSTSSVAADFGGVLPTKCRNLEMGRGLSACEAKGTDLFLRTINLVFGQ